MTLIARLQELKGHALIAASSLQYLLNTKDPRLASEAEEARARYKSDSSPTERYFKYCAVVESEFCPRCFVSGEGENALIIEAKTNALHIMKCPKCGFMPTLPKGK